MKQDFSEMKLDSSEMEQDFIQMKQDFSEMEQESFGRVSRIMNTSIKATTHIIIL